MPGIFELLIILGLLGIPVIVVLIVVLGKRNAPPANPNLISCPDCGHMVSIRADRCTQCGRPAPFK